ncbi:probable cysteine--tRNA ligase, mitochondrial [Austrofundulus limnaeus]|uniref:Probable cysteine--tRNA ligase, mitochondrial n=1 Tax=Austrofundulus limnaeus TaxID=52670 RepID=A0A2I4D692_AUSLI|nr:PREDICTED: probable cysteine--tRNA ligase, mitochondrial [Austrofundulus limnaeus]
MSSELLQLMVLLCGSVQSSGAVRSPAVFGAITSYIREVLDVFGIDLLLSQEAQEVSSGSGGLQSVVEQLTHFRSEVRSFALSRQGGPGCEKPGLDPDRAPLLRACDALRDDLAPLGVLIKDRGASSTWEIRPAQTKHKVPHEDQDPAEST